MKIPFMIIFIFIVALSTAGCKTWFKKAADSPAPVFESPAISESVDSGAPLTDPDIPPSANIDYDLTHMNRVEVYSKISDMVNDPFSYDGKTVKLNGEFSIFHSLAENKYYFSTVIYDPTMKNKQELLFELVGGNHPANSPKAGTNITVFGTFHTYTENELLYFELKGANIIG